MASHSLKTTEGHFSVEAQNNHQIRKLQLIPCHLILGPIQVLPNVPMTTLVGKGCGQSSLLLLLILSLVSFTLE